MWAGKPEIREAKGLERAEVSYKEERPELRFNNFSYKSWLKSLCLLPR